MANWFRVSNPTFNDTTYQRQADTVDATGMGVMTYGGTLAKLGVMGVLMIASASIGWTQASMPLLFGGLIGGLVLAFAMIFKPTWSPALAPLYAIAEGLLVGVISVIYQQQFVGTKYAGIVPLAVLGTLAVVTVMGALYTTRAIRVNSTFVAVTVGATIAIALTYVVTLVISMFNPGIMQLPMYQASPIGIVFSVIVIIIAAMNLALDFKLVEDGVNNQAPKYMEWYASFGILVTVVWIYLEMLRLLSKLARR